MTTVTGCRCTIDFDLRFDTLAEKFGLSIEEVGQLWNEEELTNLLTEYLDASEILGLAVTDSIDVKIGGGRTDL